IDRSGVRWSELPRPELGTLRVQRAAQPRPDTRIVAEVESGRILVRRVPDLRGDLVLLQERLESLLVVRAIENQPARRGIRFTIAEYGVEPPRDLVDEVVHVAGEAA